ncbi:MAG: hypothetical protein PHT33_06810 [bacterium]|nr:hypothetical protein [bacterium]
MLKYRNDPILFMLLISIICTICAGMPATAQAAQASPYEERIFKSPYTDETCTYTEYNSREGIKGYRITRNDGTVLEYSPDFVLSDFLGQRIRRVAANAIGRGSELGPEEYIYTGPGLLLVRYHITDGKGLPAGAVTVDVRSLQIVDGSLTGGKTMPLIPDTSPLEAARPSERIVEGIVALPYFITEGATAASALVDYLDRHGAAGMSSGKRQRDLVLSMTEAGCGCNLDKLLAKYALKQGFKLETKRFVQPVQDKEAMLTFRTFKEEIDAGHPGILVVTSCGLKRIMPVCGYMTNDTGRYVVIADQGYRGEDAPRNRHLYLNWDGIYEKMELTTVSKINK